MEYSRKKAYFHISIAYFNLILYKFHATALKKYFADSEIFTNFAVAKREMYSSLASRGPFVYRLGREIFIL